MEKEVSSIFKMFGFLKWIAWIVLIVAVGWMVLVVLEVNMLDLVRKVADNIWG